MMEFKGNMHLKCPVILFILFYFSLWESFMSLQFCLNLPLILGITQHLFYFLACIQCLEKFPVIQHFKFGSLLSIQPVKPWHPAAHVEERPKSWVFPFSLVSPANINKTGITQFHHQLHVVRKPIDHSSCKSSRLGETPCLILSIFIVLSSYLYDLSPFGNVPVCFISFRFHTQIYFKGWNFSFTIFVSHD